MYACTGHSKNTLQTKKTKLLIKKMYTPPQGQEQNKSNSSRNCTEKCAHRMTHSQNCKRYESMMLIFTPIRKTQTLLTKSNAFVYHANPSHPNSNLSQLTSQLSPVTSTRHLSLLASHLSPLTRQLSPFGYSKTMMKHNDFQSCPSNLKFSDTPKQNRPKNNEKNDFRSCPTYPKFSDTPKQ